MKDLKNPIAFFSTEYALEDELPIYAGGLGVLAGDYVLEAGFQGLPLVAVGLFYRKGFETYNSDNRSPAAPPNPEKAGFALLRDGGQLLLIEIELDSRVVLAQVWTKSYGTAKVFLLDTNVKQNADSDREITSYLYPKDFRAKLLQEIVFGIGGVKLLRRLKITPALYHLNEGHAGFVALGLVVEHLHDHRETKGFNQALKQIKPSIVATKHTVLPASGLFFRREDFRGTLDAYLSRHGVSFDDFCNIGTWEKQPAVFSMTKFLMQSTSRANAVSKLHAFFEKQHHPHSKLFPITNGVNPRRWQAQALLGTDLDKISDQKLWAIRERLRRELITFVNDKTGAKLKPDILTVIWARRFAAYKRPAVLFGDLPRLKKLVDDETRPVQFIISGQPNASDDEGIQLLKQIIDYAKAPAYADKVVYLPGYSLAVAKRLIQGADVWLNTPERGKEASGTSGMKSSLNGGLQLTIADGWAAEVEWQDRGWLLPEMNLKQDLYGMLEREVIPLFYKKDQNDLPSEWIARMRHTIKIVEKQFSTKRMLEEYLTQLYFPLKP